jgi:hypothetical protein
MKENYEAPEMEIVRFQCEDVIDGSGSDNTTEEVPF